MDTSGTIKAEYKYNAWGEDIDTTAAVSSIETINPLRYRGYYYDSETKLYYLQSRYYDPVVCRFINADEFAATGQGFLGYYTYAYCNNNPVVCADSQGDFAHIIIGGLIGGITSVVSSVATSIITGEDVDIADVAISFGLGAAEGALITAFPTCAVAISAGMSVVDSVIDDVRNGADFKTTVVNATISLGFGAVTGGNGDVLNGAKVSKAFSALSKLGRGNHPSVKSAARNAISDVLNPIKNMLTIDLAENIVYSALESGTEKVANKMVQIS